MADARSLLRAARVERRVKHPNAQYTSSGKLLCSLCEIAVKDERKAWNNHLQSTQHHLRQSQAQDVDRARASKKRKVEDVDETGVDEDRKRSRGAPGAGDETEEAAPSLEPEENAAAATQSDTLVDNTTAALEEQPNAEAEAEFAAFMGELKEADQDSLIIAPTTALNASATISAAPMTAEEIAAQAREEQSAQRSKRDAEIEGEKEEAEERLQEEFEEMEGFEDRVKRLKEKREALRRASSAGGEPPDLAGGKTEPAAAVIDVGKETEGESSDEDDYDDWAFGRP